MEPQNYKLISNQKRNRNKKTTVGYKMQVEKVFCPINGIIVSLRRKNHCIGMNNSYPSALLENAVNEFARLPGIGKKTALRLVLYLLRQEEEKVSHFAETLLRMRREITYCSVCHNISDNNICSICADAIRDRSVVCVVENVKEVMAIEKTGQFRGLYHVLGGIISPIDGIGPSDLEINSLEERVKSGEIGEVILALSATMEGDTTNFYIYRKLQSYPVKTSIIARGVSVGDEIEYADEVTLGRSILNRTPFEESYKSFSK